MTLHLDIETYSACDLGECGVYRYAEDPTTEILCIGFAFDSQDVRQWKPGEPLPADLVTHISQGGEIRAHNANFERTVLNGRAGQAIGFPHIKIEQCVCTAVKVAASGIPRSLQKAAEALGTRQKNEAGRIQLLQICQPKRPTKSDPATRWTLQNAPEKFEAMYAYNLDDVRAEREIDDAVPDLIPSEREIYCIDQRINDRGIAVDLTAVDNILWTVDDYKRRLSDEFFDLTADWLGDGLKPTQREKVSEWVRTNGYPALVDMQAETIKGILKLESVPERVKRVLAIYSTCNAKATAKLEAMRTAVCADGRLRGMFVMNGAGPGRWTSHIAQLHNLARPIKVLAEPAAAKEALDLFAKRDIKLIQERYPGIDPIKIAGSCTRGCLVAAPGHELIFSDYSGIESRVNPWFFNEQWVLEAFRKQDTEGGPDNYQTAYANAFNVPPADVSKDKRQIGKCMELFFNYEGGVSAFLTAVDTYHIDLQEMTEAVLPLLPDKAREHGEWMWENHRKQGVTHDQSIACDGLKYLWRESHPNVKQGWKDLKKAAEMAVEFQGQSFGIPSGRIWFKVIEYRGRKWLRMRLPSGRDIKYYNPRWIEPKKIVRPQKVAEGQYVDVEVLVPGEFRYWGVDPDTNQWGEKSTYGGHLDENADQGFSSCLLRNGMREWEASGELPIVGHVHDELIAEVPVGAAKDLLARSETLMCKQPSYTAGLPLAAKGMRQHFYWKEP